MPAIFIQSSPGTFRFQRVVYAFVYGIYYSDCLSMEMFILLSQSYWYSYLYRALCKSRRYIYNAITCRMHCQMLKNIACRSPVGYQNIYIFREKQSYTGRSCKPTAKDEKTP